jgi:pimeloyl-ACP methyl ester carboxylesterase
LGGLSLALCVRPLRRRFADALALDERYLHGAGFVLRAPATWRAFVIEQRALIHGLPFLEERLSRISAPTTIIAGAADRIVRISSARRLATQIPRAELVVLERASHLIPQQYADRVAEVVAAVAG